MIRVRQIVSAIAAIAVSFAGAIGAEPAHAHAFNAHHIDATHLIAVDADADHHASFSHDHGLQLSDDDADPQSDYHNAVFHFHAPCFVAIIADTPVFGEVSVKHIVMPPEAFVSVLTRSTTPPDRPPRILL